MAASSSRLTTSLSRSATSWTQQASFSSSSSVSADVYGSTTQLPPTSKPRAVAQRGSGRRGATIKPHDPFNFNDIPSVGYYKMIAMKEQWDLHDKVNANDAILRAQSVPFKPPTLPIRVTRQINLGQPDHVNQARRRALVPVSTLPLEGKDAIHRLKLIAGQRWYPNRTAIDDMATVGSRYRGKREGDMLDIEAGNKGFNGGQDDIGKEGWLALACDKFDEGRMNRKFISDTIERLVEAANDPKSPLTDDIPLDTRHLVSRQKKSRYGPDGRARRLAVVREKRNETVGGIKGYPAEWVGKSETQSESQTNTAASI